MAAEAPVSVVIPTWNRSALLKAALEGLQRQTQRPAEIIVVDNGSNDDTIAVANSSGASVISLGSNRGFAAAVNAGVEKARSEWIFVLNNDVELDEHWTEHALLAAASERAFIVTGKLLQGSKPDHIDGTWDLLALSGCAWRCGWNTRDGPRWTQRKPAAMVSFTACLIHRRVFEAVGLLDTSYGSYYEDVDFGLRCALAGFSAVFEPASLGSHKGSATLGSGSKTAYLISRNQVLLARKFGLTRIAGLRVLFGQALFLLTRMRLGGFLAALRGKWDGLRAVTGSFDADANAAGIKGALSQQEKQIAALQREFGWDSSWKIYFAVLGCG